MVFNVVFRVLYIMTSSVSLASPAIPCIPLAYFFALFAGQGSVFVFFLFLVHPLLPVYHLSQVLTLSSIFSMLILSLPLFPCLVLRFVPSPFSLFSFPLFCLPVLGFPYPFPPSQSICPLSSCPRFIFPSSPVHICHPWFPFSTDAPSMSSLLRTTPSMSLLLLASRSPFVLRSSSDNPLFLPLSYSMSLLPPTPSYCLIFPVF